VEIMDDNGCICQRCGKKYIIDLMIQDKLWRRITPSKHKEAGLLCPTCICEKLGELGMATIHAKIDTKEIR